MPQVTRMAFERQRIHCLEDLLEFDEDQLKSLAVNMQNHKEWHKLHPDTRRRAKGKTKLCKLEIPLCLK